MKKSLAFLPLPFLSLLIMFNYSSMASKLDTNTTIPYSNFNKLSRLHSSQNLSLVNSDSLEGVSDEENYNRTGSYYLPIFPQRFGALVPLSFGTPPKTLYYIFHTGSGLTWFPCGNITLHKNRHKKTPLFDPSLSSSYKLPGCYNIMTKFYLRDKRFEKICRNCEARKSDLSCSKPLGYQITYFQGFTKGFLLTEKLTIQQQTIPKFLVGCSSTFNTPNGFAGFGRGILSLPFQLGINGFSYCISSSSQSINMKQGSYLRMTTYTLRRVLNTIEFHASPHFLFRDFYYVIIRYIIVGEKKIEVPQNAQVPRPDGFGGTIIDSGTTFTTMERNIFNSVTREFEAQLGKGTFIDNMIDKTRACFNISGRKVKGVPKLAFQFQGDTLMELQQRNYIIDRHERGMICLSIVAKANVVPTGPAIILGYSQQLDFHWSFDLDNMKLGLTKSKSCST